jgi:hypothetical protein
VRFNYNDALIAKEKLKKSFLIYLISISAPFIYIVIDSKDIIPLMTLVICFLPVLLLLYYAISKHSLLEKPIFEFIELFNPDEIAVYCSGLFTYVTMKKLNYYVLVRDFRFRLFYVCKGIEDYARLTDKFSFTIGRIARRTKLVNYFESNGLLVRISKGEIVIPHPRDRDKVIRGRGFKILCYRPYHTTKPEETFSLISGISLHI